MVPVTAHPLPVGSAVSFAPSRTSPPPYAATPFPSLRFRNLVALHGQARRDFGTIEEVVEDGVQIYYTIRRADGEMEKRPAVRVSRASLLDVIAKASDGPL